MKLNEIMELKNNKKVKRIIRKYGRIVIAIILIAVLAVIGHRVLISHDSKTTKIGFENIGQLATQSAYCTEVNVTDASRELWGAKIPFTQSKYIYSYDFVIKAGFDFEKISWTENNHKITVTLPEAEILSCESVDDSFKVFHEQESIFRQMIWIAIRSNSFMNRRKRI